MPETLYDFVVRMDSRMLARVLDMASCDYSPLVQITVDASGIKFHAHDRRRSVNVSIGVRAKPDVYEADETGGASSTTSDTESISGDSIKDKEEDEDGDDDTVRLLAVTLFLY